MSMHARLPWWLQETDFNDRGQSILNKHGLKPKHRRMQQHPIVSGLAGQKTLHDQLEDGQIVVKRGINSFTSDGVFFKDKDGNDELIPTKVDAVIFATGYRQQAGFIDPQVLVLFCISCSYYFSLNAHVFSQRWWTCDGSARGMMYHSGKGV